MTEKTNDTALNGTITTIDLSKLWKPKGTTRLPVYERDQAEYAYTLKMREEEFCDGKNTQA